jgi:ferredoxin-NADP reductase
MATAPAAPRNLPGGIGIAPLRALLESLPAAPGALTLIYRASHPRDLVFREELELLARHRDARVHDGRLSRPDRAPARPRVVPLPSTVSPTCISFSSRTTSASPAA